MSGESPRILKANAVRELGARVSFNFEDLRQAGESVYQEAQTRAESLLRQAEEEVARLRAEAQQSGHAEGHAAGLQRSVDEIRAAAKQLADAQLQTEYQTAMPAFQALIAGLHADREKWLAHWESAAIELALAIAEKVIRRQLAMNPELSPELVRAALQLAAGQPQLRARLNPQDLEAFGDHAERVVQELTGCADATLIADPAVSLGGCIVETQHGRIDSQIETQLERLAEELTAD